jgi:hypothetical protein
MIWLIGYLILMPIAAIGFGRFCKVGRGEDAQEEV